MAIGERALAAHRSLLESTWAKRIAALVGCLAILLYLSPHLTIGPNHVDEALNLELIHLTARGRRLHFDFIDAYGPLHHLGPALAWHLAGETTWGVRIWILLVKVVSIGLTFGFVARMSDRSTAWLATLWLTVLL